MIIESIHVKNFRCILDAELLCDSLTVLIGPNGAGKSSFLRAMELFYTIDARLSEDDFFNGDTSQEISIKMNFGDLTDLEIELFKPYLDGEKLIVEKVLSWPSSKGSQRYFGWRLQNPDFDAFRSSSGQGLRAEYNSLREGGYSDFLD